MDSSITGNNIVISPRRKYLSAEELAAHRSIFNQPKISPDNELERLYTKLRISISSPRIERVGGRSLAVWDAERGMARVTRIEGKFHTFGTTYDQQLYLDCFEALYLLEAERLQLEYYARKVSIEQAYVLLLGEESSPRYCEYLVYAYLTRAGYIITRHKNRRFYQNHEATETNCIWAWLFNAIESTPVPNNIKRTQMFANIKRQIDTIKGSIIEQRSKQDTLETPSCSTQNKTTAIPFKQIDTIKGNIIEERPMQEAPTCSTRNKTTAIPFKQIDTIKGNIIEERPMQEAPTCSTRNKTTAIPFKQIDTIKGNIIEERPMQEAPTCSTRNKTTAIPFKQIDTIKGNIIEERPMQEAPTCSTRNKTTAMQLKRKHSDDTAPSCSRKYFCESAKSFLDFMTTEPEYKKFVNIFNNFDLVKIRPTRRAVREQTINTNDNDNDDDDSNDFDDLSDAIPINFDLYTHHSGFKKSAPKPPLMRVLVLSASNSFPNHTQISLCFRKLFHSTPILVVSVGNAKQIQAFLYYFTT